MQFNFFRYVSKIINFMFIIVQPNPGNYFLMFKSYPNLLFFLFFITACHSTATIDHIETKVYPLGTQGFTQTDSGIYKSILPYKEVLDSQMDLVLAYSDQVMEKGQPEGLLGNFVADVCLVQANKKYKSTDGHPIDFCFLNNGGLRASLPKGNLTKRKIFELMPFENELIVLTLEGTVVRQLADFISAKGGMPVAGTRITIRGKMASQMLIGASKLDTTRTYKVVTSDYLAYGGDNMSFLSDTKLREPIGLKLRDAIIQYLDEKKEMNETIKIELDQRIEYAK